MFVRFLNFLTQRTVLVLVLVKMVSSVILVAVYALVKISSIAKTVLVKGHAQQERPANLVAALHVNLVVISMIVVIVGAKGRVVQGKAVPHVLKEKTVLLAVYANL